MWPSQISDTLRTGFAYEFRLCGRKLCNSDNHYPTVLHFLNQIFPKRIFPAENGENEHHYWILNIRVSLGMIFQLKRTILIFWNTFAQKDYFLSKTEKVNVTTEFPFFKFWAQTSPKVVFLVENGKSKHLHRILHIRTGLCTRFHLKQRISNFAAKFIQKEYFRSKTEKSHLCVRPWSLLY